MGDASKYQYKHFKVDFPAEYVAHVQLDRPEKMNALNPAMWENMPLLFNQLSRDPNVRAIMLSGAGDRAFCAGLDVTSDAAASGWSDFPDHARKIWAMRRHIAECQASIRSIEKCEKPVIALLHGVVYGGGLEIPLACDIRYCTSKARFCIKETDVGLAPDVGGLTWLPKIGVSYSWAKEMTYTARVWQGEEALRVGFVSKVVETKDELLQKGLELAKEIASKSPLAVQGSKAIMDFSRDRPLDDGLHFTATWTSAFADAEDVKTAMTSGLKRTKPKFAKL